MMKNVLRSVAGDTLFQKEALTEVFVVFKVNRNQALLLCMEVDVYVCGISFGINIYSSPSI